MNDGPLAFRLMHPKYRIEKTYHVTVEGAVGAGAMRSLRRGELPDEAPRRPLAVQRLDRIHPDEGGAGSTVLEFRLNEGRKRQIRRYCRQAGLEVTRLQRVALDGIRLGSLPPGDWRPLRPSEIVSLQKSVGLMPRSRRRSGPAPGKPGGRRGRQATGQEGRA
jgi:pseudouridine synthase